MKHKTRTKALSWLLSLVMVLGLVIGMSSTAYADYAAIWTEDQTISMDKTIDGGVAVSTDAGIKLTIDKGVTLTVNGGITAGTRTLTIEGKGTLVVNGADQNTVGTTGDNGANGHDGTYAQNCGVAGGNGGNGAGGGVGIEANLVVNGVTVIVTGGTGGKGGKGGDGGNGYGDSPAEERRPGGSGGTGGTGGAGGVGIKGSVTVNSGSITVTGGAGGDGGDGGAAGQYSQGSFYPEGNGPTAGVKGQDGSPGQAVSGTITNNTENEDAQESDDGSSWTAISGTSSTKRYVKVAHLHSFTYSASGATITATCSKTGCELTDNKATLTIAAPLHTNVNDGQNADATITDANSIKGDATVRYYAATKNGETYTKGDALESESAPTGAGDYVAEITVGGKTASVGYTISKTAQDAPTGFKSTSAATPYANGSINDGSPAISTTNLQVKAPGSTEWVAVDSFPVSGKPGVYQFKYQGTDALSESPVTSVLLEADNELREVKITSNRTDANLYKDSETNTLTAVTNTNVTGLTLEYAWYREGVTAAVGTGNTYALQAADVGKKLTVTVTDKTEGATEPYTRVSTATPVIVTVAPTTYQITGNVQVPTADGGSEYNNVANADVELRQGNTVFATATTGSDGNYTFDSVPNGEYNIVVTSGEKTKTAYVKVENGDQPVNVEMPFYKVSSKVDVKGETPAAVVAGLDAAAVDNLTAAEKADDVTTTVTMEIESTADLTAKEDTDLTAAQEKKKAEQQAIKDQNTGASKSDALDFLDMSVYKRTQKTGESAQVENVPNLSKVLEIMLPYTTANRSFNIFRYHDNTATTFERLTSRPTDTFTDGQFFVGDGFIAIYASGFSTYAIGYTETAAAPAASGGSSGGGYGALTYPPIIAETANGTVTVSPAAPKAGNRVTVTATPDAGYTVDTVTVTDANGKAVEVTKNEDGAYTFTQPRGKVKIDVTYKADGEAAPAPTPSPAGDAFGPYTDLDASAWYAAGIRYALENGVMSGYGDGKFGPSDTTSRAMLAQILYNLEGRPAYGGAADFTDVNGADWYAAAIAWASGEGLVGGYGDGLFGPQDMLTREQLVTILYRYARFKGLDVSAGEDTNLLGYDDAGEVSDWAAAAMQWAVGSGLVNGKTDTTLNPQDTATRAEIATILMRYCENLAN